METIIIGAGLSGLEAGYTLSKKGHKVTILEKEPILGGLASSFDINGEKIPICYHHIMLTDSFTRNLIKELAIEDKLFNRKVRMGFYYKGKIHNLSEPWHLIFFSPLSIASRIKFGLFGARILVKNNWTKEDEISAEEWLREKTNQEVLDKMFAPLLKIKFGKDSEKIAASWVGTRLKMRESSGPFGYLDGGIETIVQTLKQKIEDNGGKVITGAEVKSISTDEEKKKITSITYTQDGKEKTLKADAYLYTGPAPLLTKMLPLPTDYRKDLEKIRYKSTICVSLGLDRSYNDYYWTNFIDGKRSFGGVLDQSKLNIKLKNAKSMFYVFTYLDTDDKLWKMDDKELLATYVKDLKEVYPEIDKHIKWHNIARMRYSKPVYEIEYKNYCPEIETPIGNLYLAGISTIYPLIRNMGSALESGKKAGDIIDSKHRKS